MGCSNTKGACAQLHKVEFAGLAARNFRIRGAYTEISCFIDLSGPGGRIRMVPGGVCEADATRLTIQLLMITDLFNYKPNNTYN